MMAAVALFAILMLVCAVSAYDFSNSFFNHDLHTVMELFQEHSRLVRRDVTDEKCQPEAGYIHATCCNRIESFRALGVDAMKNCTVEITNDDSPSDTDPFSCNALRKKMDQATCLFQCLMKQMNGCDEEGNLNEDKLITLVSETIEGDDMKAVALEAVSACVNKANVIQAEHARAMTTPYPYSTSYPYYTDSYYRTGTPYYTPDYYSTRSYNSYTTSRPTGSYYTTYRPSDTSRSPYGYYTTQNPFYSGTYRPTGATPASAEGKCSTAPLTFLQCFWETVILKCPVDNVVSSKDCDNVRNYLKQQEGNNV